MEPLLWEWLQVALRWAHVVAAIMWIGDSFLFMWLDSHLEPPRKQREGAVIGELWLTHGGGFYEMVKRSTLAKEELPPKLYWFMWESYSTWITGFFLITVVFYFSGQALLVIPGGPISHGQGVGLSLGLLVAGVAVYELLCKTPLLKQPVGLGLLGLVLATALSWALLQVFHPRAVFLQVGAMLASMMSANVWRRIIPGQRHMLAQTKAGLPVDPSYGVRGKLHSRHNHYLTFPVLFLMLSNHFPSLYGGRFPWLTVAGMAVVGVGVKLFMNLRGKTPAPMLAGSLAALALVVWSTLPVKAEGAVAVSEQPVSFARAQAIVQSRCVGCHAVKPANPSFGPSPGGVTLESPEQIVALQERILARAVLMKTMPLANLTQMTDGERAELGAWIRQGARVDAP